MTTFRTVREYKTGDRLFLLKSRDYNRGLWDIIEVEVSVVSPPTDDQGALVEFVRVGTGEFQTCYCAKAASKYLFDSKVEAQTEYVSVKQEYILRLKDEIAQTEKEISSIKKAPKGRNPAALRWLGPTEKAKVESAKNGSGLSYEIKNSPSRRGEKFDASAPCTLKAIYGGGAVVCVNADGVVVYTTSAHEFTHTNLKAAKAAAVKHFKANDLK